MARFRAPFARARARHGVPGVAAKTGIGNGRVQPAPEWLLISARTVLAYISHMVDRSMPSLYMSQATAALQLWMT